MRRGSAAKRQPCNEAWQQHACHTQKAAGGAMSHEAGAPVLADKPLQRLEGGRQQEVGGEHGAEASDGRVQLLVHVCRVGVAIACCCRGEQRAAVDMEPAVQRAQLVQACRQVAREVGRVGRSSAVERRARGAQEAARRRRPQGQPSAPHPQCRSSELSRHRCRRPPGRSRAERPCPGAGGPGPRPGRPPAEPAGPADPSGAGAWPLGAPCAPCCS